MWIEIYFEHCKNIILGIIYRPPSGDITRFCEELTDIVNDVSTNTNKDIFLMGDFNIQYNDKTTAQFKELLQFEQLTSFSQLISEPTRNDNIIDLIYTNCDSISQKGVLNVYISDHELIYCTRKKKHSSSFMTEFIGRSYRNYDKVHLQTVLSEHDWADYMSYNEVNRCWDYILHLINSLLDEMCPIRKKHVKSKNEPWITNEILELIFEKNRAWKKAKRSKSDEDVAHAKYLRNHTKSVIRRAKSNFVQDYLDNDTITVKKFWEKINYVMPSKSSSSKINLINKLTNNHVPDDDIAHYVNSFFANIGSKLAEDFNKEWVDDLTLNSLQTLNEIHVEENMLLSIIQKIDVYKSSSITNISSGVLKDAFLVILPQLVHMFELSFTTSIFPDSWKVANIIPLQKPGDPTDVNNLRPISLLPLPGKMIERIVHTQVSAFLEENELYSEKQGGFRKGRSTITTVAYFTDDILTGVKDKQYTLATFIDLKKAFDTVNHKILLQKLPHYGLSHNIVTWINSYLSNRSQCCTVNGITSS